MRLQLFLLDPLWRPGMWNRKHRRWLWCRTGTQGRTAGTTTLRTSTQGRTAGTTTGDEMAQMVKA